MPAATIRDLDGDLIGTVDRNLLVKPLEFIVADHLRQRHLCCVMERLADEPLLNRALAVAVADHISGEMTIHVIDEEEDLFPLLRRRAWPEDDVERVLGLLSREHFEDDRIAEAIVAGLRETVEANAEELSLELRAALRDFARRQRRHLAVENAVIMPLAEIRLTPKDREGLARRMAVRRGIYPERGGQS